MSKKKKASIIILSLLIGLPVAEIVREEITYLIISRNLKVAFERTKSGMSKEEVKLLAGEPDRVRAGTDGETWDWDAMNHQGALWRMMGLAWVKGHYSFSATFDNNGKVAQTWGGII